MINSQSTAYIGPLSGPELMMVLDLAGPSPDFVLGSLGYLPEQAGELAYVGLALGAVRSAGHDDVREAYSDVIDVLHQVLPTCTAVLFTRSIVEGLDVTSVIFATEDSSVELLMGSHGAAVEPGDLQDAGSRLRSRIQQARTDEPVVVRLVSATYNQVFALDRGRGGYSTGEAWQDADWSTNEELAHAVISRLLT